MLIHSLLHLIVSILAQASASPLPLSSLRSPTCTCLLQCLQLRPAAQKSLKLQPAAQQEKRLMSEVAVSHASFWGLCARRVVSERSKKKARAKESSAKGPERTRKGRQRKDQKGPRVVVARFVRSPAPLARGVVTRRHLQPKMLVPSLRSLRPKMLVPSPRSLRRARPPQTVTSWT